MFQKVALDHPYLQYTGRIDDRDPERYVFEFVATSLRLRLRGGGLKLRVENRTNYYQSRLGVIINGELQAVLLPEQGEMVVDLSDGLRAGENEVCIYKRQDASHQFTLCELELDGELLPPPERPVRRIEFYGDSVTAGEVTEAEDYVGQPDPPHQGEYSNSWWGYAWQTTRLLGAEMHDVAQGGIALQDGVGWFNAPDYVGMLSAYDKVRYNPCYGEAVPWGFARWTPHVVVMAIGQNDAHPEDFMAAEPEGEKAQVWRRAYRGLLETLHGKYPKAVFVLATTILGHDKAWDEAIDRVCCEMRADGETWVHHFLYSQNGCGTPGHIRKREAAVMAQELSSFINTLGEDVWQDA